MKAKKKQEENCKVADTFIALVERELGGFLWVFSGVVGRGVANLCSSCGL